MNPPRLRPLFPLLFAIALLALLVGSAAPASAAAQINVYQDWDSVEVPNGNSFGFPNAAVNVSTSRLFRITNHGNATLTISNPTSTVTGSGFSQIETPASSVAPGASTTVRVRLLKTSAGMAFGKLTINSNATPSFHVVHLAGSAGTFAPPAQSMFVLSTAEKNNWTPPTSITYNPTTCALSYGTTPYWDSGSFDQARRYIWESFCLGQARTGPLSPYTSDPAWFNANHNGSQNHGMIYVGVAALSQALRGTAADYDAAAQQAIDILKLDLQPTGQGHMRHESMSQYVAVWEPAVAAMALAGQYQPNGATKGAELPGRSPQLVA